MARRNVDLIIRARDEAGRALTRLTSRVREFAESQQQLQQESAETGSSLRRLNRDINQSDRGGTRGQDRLTQQLQGRRREVELLAQEMREARQATSGYNTGLNRLAGDLGRLNGLQEQQRAAVERQSATTRRAEQEYARLGRQTRRAAADTDRANAALQRANERYFQNFQTLGSLTNAYNRLQQAIQRQGGATRAQERRLQSLSSRIARARALEAEYSQTLRETRQAYETQAAGINRVRTARADAASRVREESTALERLRTTLRGTDDALAGVTAENRRFAQSAQRAAAEAERLRDAQVRARLETTRAAAAGVTGAPSDVGVRTQSLRALRESVADLRRYRVATDLARERTTRLGAEIARLGDRAGPELRRDFESARASLAQLETQTRELAQANNRLRANLRGVGTSVASVGGQAQAAAVGVERLGNAARRTGLQLAQQARSGRQALTFFQRIRSEVIALTTAYVGLFAAFRGFGEITNALRTVQGAQSRLTALFEGDTARTAEELEFLRQTARRLGIQFGVLSNTYSKFAIATQGTIIQGEETRRIFVAVAESARVNQLPIADLVAVFRALEQIASKGVFQMEELRQQLGDRLPGAINILAQALDVPLDVLSKLLEQGEVGAERLSDFADVLETRFGSRLSSALLLLEARIGQFGNAVFELFRAIGEGEFGDAFIELLVSLTETLEGAQVQEFADTISSALAGLIGVIQAVAANWDLLLAALTGLVALGIARRLTPAFVGLVQQLDRVNRSSRRAAIGMRLLGRSFRAFLASTGVGLVFAVLASGISLFITRNSDAGDALEAHRGVVQRVTDAYKALGDEVEDVGSVLNEVTQTELDANLRQTEAALRAQQQRIRDIIQNTFDVGQVPGRSADEIRSFQRLVTGLLDQYVAGDITLRDFIGSVDELSNTVFRDGAPALERIAVATIEAARATEEYQTAFETAFALSADADAASRAIAEAGDASNQAQAELNANLKQAEARETQVNEILRERREILERYQAQLSRGADEETLERTRDRLAEINERLQAATTSALELFRAVDLGNPELTAGVQAGVEAAIARLENIADTSADDTLRPIAQFFRLRFQEFTQLRQAIVEEIQESLERGGNLAEINVQPLIDAQNAARVEAQRALAAYRGLDNQTAEIQTEIGRLESFIRTSREDVNRILLLAAQAQVEQLTGLRNGLEQQLAEQIGRGESEDVIEQTRRELRGLDADIAQAVDTGIRLTQAFEGAEPAIQSLQRGFEALRDDAARNAILQEIQAYQQRIASLGQLRTTLQQTLNDAITRGGDPAQINRLGNEIAAVENQMRAAADEAQLLAFQLDENDIAAQQVAASIRNLYIELNRGTDEGTLQAQQQHLQELIRLDEQLTESRRRGIGDQDQLRQQQVEVREEIRLAFDEAIRLAEALADGSPAVQALIVELKRARGEMAGLNESAIVTGATINMTIASTGSNALGQFAEDIANGRNAVDALRGAFRQFAADFLLRIADMILQQAILNALQSAGIGGGISGAIGAIVGHSGIRSVPHGADGVRFVDPRLFHNAVRLHEGTAGLRANEFPAILERGETVLTEGQTRAIGDRMQGSALDGLTVINAVDSVSFMEQALNTRQGENVLLNKITARRGKFQRALGI